MNRTNIEWVRNPDGGTGYTFNPITGCLNHNNGLCKGGSFPCYAYRLANGRLKQRYLANKNIATMRLEEIQTKGLEYTDIYEIITDPFYPRFWVKRLEEPMRVKKPSGVFVCDMSDLFGVGIPEQWTGSVMNFIEACPQHRFYLLTKQPQNLIKFSPFSDNCYIGVTATRYWKYVDACNYLSQIKAEVKFLSLEPLLSWDSKASYFFNRSGIAWLIIGAQTKPYKPPKIEWVNEIVEAADKAGIPVFLKDNLSPLLKYPIEYRWAFIEDRGCYHIRQELPK